MTNALVVKAANLIRNGDIAGAEFALVSLAETEGDYALVAALDTLPPKDLLAVIREYDTSKESVVNLLVTPEQFARAVVMERLYGDHSHVRLRGMVNAVLFRDDSHTGEFLEAIGDVDGGCEALIDYLSDRDEEVVHFVTYDTFNVNRTEEGDAVDKSEVSDRDWKELTWLLKHEHADMFEQIWPVLKKRLKERLRREAELELQEQKNLEQLDRPTARPAAAVQTAPVVDPGEESAL
ncbi:hypothetical protein SAMN04515618_10290 [Collimonas sp. OK307]|uniref:hypothetical protein n=1 Tax=Collimonas sp. OK307 TaxID=1801620 RepID=UPI0008EBBB00|nr:hypothetical protein [Collimonas sp. OK307]SFH71738.1 hypothetical protein SAMN04515618_10290 [Collimonas sp. OK307]